MRNLAVPLKKLLKFLRIYFLYFCFDKYRIMLKLPQKRFKSMKLSFLLTNLKNLTKVLFLVLCHMKKSKVKCVF